jgi:asparagine synthase (glutamine-hydrolysing)
MCGIAGVITSDTGINVSSGLEAMVCSLAHRGPDSRGLIVRNVGKWSVGLAHTRLAILDLSEAGHQPMAGGRARHWLTYNGEVYNFRSLREELGGDPSEWRSLTDTEVILRAYEKWDTDALSRFRGMFAFGLWDEPKHRLLLTRDEFGIKPLYYYQTKDTIVFASEIRALLDSGIVPRKLSRQGVASYLETGSCKAPLTIIDGVRSLLPGNYTTVDINDELQVSHSSFLSDIWPELPERRVPKTRRAATAELFEVLKESVRLHLISDVPLGVFLSGGVDSSALLALMKQVSTERPKSFSVVFSEAEFSEAVFAKLVAHQFATDHHEIHLTEQRLFEWLPSGLESMDQPTIDGINTYVVSKATKEAGITVALSGLGGDELFAGYPSFHRALRAQSLRRIPRRLRRATASVGTALLNGSTTRTKVWDLFGSDASPQAVYSISRRLFSSREIRSLLSEQRIESAEEATPGVTADSINAISMLEIQGYMANTLLRDSDSMSMASSLELRVPFVDSEVVRFVLQLPGSWKMQGNGPKPLLLDALNGLLPEFVWNRPKMGFSFPFERWMASALKPDIDDALGPGGCLNLLGFEVPVVRSVWGRFIDNPKGEKWSRPWALFVIQKWCDLNRVKA